MRHRALIPEANRAAAKELAPVIKRGKTRDLEMFKLWLQGGHTCERIAKMFDLKVRQVYKIKKRDGWEKLRKELLNRFYSKLAMRLKGFTVRLTDVMERDFLKIEEKVNNNEALDKDERRYLTKLADILLKENRLSDGKPTEILNKTGVVKHEIRLPPGVKRYGVIPVDPNVLAVEHKPDQPKTEEEKQGRISIEDVEGE